MHPKLTKAWKALPEQFRRELHTKLLVKRAFISYHGPAIDNDITGIRLTLPETFSR